MAILLGTIVSRFIIQAFAESALMFYIGAFIFVFGSYSMSIEKSLLTQCVSENELGKIFAVNAALENFGPLGASQVYASVWSVSICSYYSKCESCFITRSSSQFHVNGLSIFFIFFLVLTKKVFSTEARDIT